MRRALPMLLLVAAACGDNRESTSVDAPPPAFTDARHPHPPSISSGGGPVLAAPALVPIFFAADPMQTTIEKFLLELGRSAFFHATTSEYGVGPATLLPSIITTDPPPTTDAMLQNWIEAQVTARAWPQPDANTLFLVFLPAGIVLKAGSSTSCVDFGGYHDETGVSKIVYALLPRCATQNAQIDELTPALGHEIIEAATDPHPASAPGFNIVDQPDLVWAFTPGGELGDMCEFVSAAYRRMVGTFLVQRSWSNASALAGHDPCVPALPGPYVGSAPYTHELELHTSSTHQITTQGIQISNGSSGEVDVYLFSDAPAPDWTVGVDDVASVVQHQPAELSLSLDRTTGNNGDRLGLTIKRLKDGDGGGSEFVVTTKIAGEVVSLWWGLVTN